MSLNLKSSGGGSVTVDVPSTASNYTATLPAADGTVQVSGNQPAFSACPTATVTVSNNTFTKIKFDTITFDTNSNFDTTNNRFTPTVAGYYQFNAVIPTSAMAASAGMVQAFLYKNGSRTNGVDGQAIPNQSGSGSCCSVSGLLFLNGSTDYVEVYLYQTSGASVTVGAQGPSRAFSGALVRAA